MLPYSFFDFSLLLLAFCFASVHSSSVNQIQFYDSSTKYGVAITSAMDQNGTQIRLHLTAPAQYGWAAFGSGHMMHDSAMFIVYPNEAGDALTLSIRSTDAHHTPKPLEPGKINATLVTSSVQDGQMSALIQWRGDIHGVVYDACRVTDPAQPFIWAVGPNQKIASNDPNFAIQMHSQYGVIFANMPGSQNVHITDPVIQGTSNSGIRPQPGAYHRLIIVHACLLVAAFLVVFPTAVIGLRLNLESSFRIHWMSQVFGSVGVLTGFIIAVVTSIIGIRFSSLSEPHQIIGILVCSGVGVQVWLGREHHIHHVLYQKRSWYSHLHLMVGRLVMYGGMINAALGFNLAGLSKISIAAGVFAILIILAVEAMSGWYHYRRARNQIPDIEPLVLKGYTKTQSKDFTIVEERMLSDVEVRTEYTRPH